MRLLALFTLCAGLLAPLLRTAEPGPLPFDAVQRDAREVHALLAAAIRAPDPAHPSLGVPLAAYAKNAGTAPARHEAFEAAARRILVGTSPTLLAPDATSQRLTALADAIDATLDRLEATRADLRPAALASATPALRATALLARFHARRILAAVHYNLFLRGQRLAELYAATLDAQAALATWRQLVAVAEATRAPLTFGSPPLTLTGEWRAELTRLEFDYRDLEAMCCPPDEAWLREKVWQPTPTAAPKSG